MTRALPPADWRTLLAVRESRTQRERQHTAAARRSVAETLCTLQSARDEQEQCVAACLALARHARVQAAEGTCRIDALRGCSDYGQWLHARVASAAEMQQTAAQGHALQLAALVERSAALRRAAARLRAAQALQQLQQRADAATREQRADDRLEDVARQQWLVASTGPRRSAA